MADLTFSSIKELKDHLKANMDKLPRTMQTAALKIAAQAGTWLSRYPRRNTGPVKWASEKQRRWYHAMRRREGLPARYTRRADPMSQRLGQSWAAETRPNGAMVGTRATYALWVQSSEYQQPMHQDTGWTTDEQVIDKLKKSGIIEKIVNAELKALFG